MALRYRIALLVVVAQLLLVGVVLWQTQAHFTAHSESRLARTERTLMALLGELAVPALVTGEYRDYQGFLREGLAGSHARAVLLVDDRNRVVAGTDARLLGTEAPLLSDTAARYWRERGITGESGPLGRLAVQFSAEESIAAANEARTLALQVALPLLVVIALIGLATGRFLTRRLQSLSETAAALAREEPRSDTAGNADDEVTVLAAALQRLTRRLDERTAARDHTQRRLRALLDNTAEAIYGLDRDHRCTFANPACVHLLGYTDEAELLGREMHELIHHRRRDGSPYPVGECAIVQTLRTGEKCHADDEVLWRADGSAFDAEYWVHPVREDGEITGSIVTFLDISERRAAERARRRSEHQMQLLLESTGEGICGVDLRGQCTFVNRAAAELLGYADTESLLGRDIDELLHRPASATPVEAGTEERYVLSRNDGIAFTVAGRTSPIMDEGRTVGSIVTFWDIAPRLAAEEARRRSEERFKQVFDMAPGAIVIQNESGLMLDANPAFTELSGFTPQEFRGRYRREIIDWVEPGAFDNYLAALDQTGEVRNCEAVLRVKHGRLITVLISARVMHIDGQRCRVSMLRDISDLRNAQDALVVSESRFRDFAETAADWFWEMDAEQHYTYLSPQFEQVTGRPNRTWLGLDRDERHAVYGYASPQRVAYYRALDERKRFSEIEVSLRRADGSLRHITLSGGPLFDEAGQLVGYRGVGRDVTALKEAQEALRASEYRFRRFAEMAVDWFWELDAELRFTAAAGGFGEVLGIPVEEIIGRTRAQLHAHQGADLDDPHWQRHFEMLAAHQPFRDFEVLWKRPDGSTRDLALTGEPVFDDDDGAFRGYLGVGRDITHVKNVHRSLQASERRLRDYTKMAADWLWEMDAELRFTAMSGRLEELIGLRPSDVIGLTREQAHARHADLQSPHWVGHLETLRRRQPFDEFEFEYVSPDDSRHILSITGRPLFDEHGEFLGYRGVGRDVTERHRTLAATSRLLAENRALTRGLVQAQEDERARIARELHDEFGQALTAIQADAETIRRLSRAQSRVRSSVEAILSTTASVYEAMHSLMERLHPALLDAFGLPEALRELVGAWSASHGSTRCELAVEGLDDCPDALKLPIYRIVQECLTNTARHARASQVSVQVRRRFAGANACVELSVIDDGAGTDLLAPRSSGLGLAGIRERIDSLGGTARFESTPRGGFRVYCRIPEDQVVQDLAS